MASHGLDNLYRLAALYERRENLLIVFKPDDYDITAFKYLLPDDTPFAMFARFKRLEKLLPAWAARASYFGIGRSLPATAMYVDDLEYLARVLIL